jgi:hypothetical protein
VGQLFVPLVSALVSRSVRRPFTVSPSISDTFMHNGSGCRPLMHLMVDGLIERCSVNGSIQKRFGANKNFPIGVLRNTQTKALSTPPRKRLRKSRNRYSETVQRCLGISERRTEVHASGEQLRRRMSTKQGLHPEGRSIMGEIDRKEEQLPTRPRSRPSWEVIRCVLARGHPQWRHRLERSFFLPAPQNGP